MKFKFGEFTTDVHIRGEIPVVENIITLANNKPLIVCDENTSFIADKICNGNIFPRCVLKSGEENKNWQAVESILAAANEAFLGRDGIFIGIGGGVIGDLCGFAASIYKRGCRLVLVPTTLLAMVDASVGGKTGFDLFGIKNLAGSFYPAQTVYMPIASLSSLPQREWKSGIGELIKTAILDNDSFIDMLSEIKKQITETKDFSKLPECDLLGKCIERAVLVKGRIVSSDPKELGKKRALLNLGHSFAHALESSCGLGNISHGEAVAWGIARSCELGIALGVTPQSRAFKIRELIETFGYCCACPHPITPDTESFFAALKRDKKNKQGKLTFVVPGKKSALLAALETDEDLNILMKIIKGDFNF